MSDERRSDPKTVAIFVLDERECGIAIRFRTSTMYANPNRLSYGYIDNFGQFVKKVKSEEMEAIEKVTLVETGFSQKNVQYIENDAAEKIKQMVKALKAENNDKEKLIESLQKQVRTLAMECNQLSSDNRRNEAKTNDAALMKVEVERDFYKAQYEKMFAMLLER